MNSKLYRCGWCGNITQPNGQIIHDKTIWNRIASILDRYGNGHTEKTPGDCCRNQYESN